MICHTITCTPSSVPSIPSPSHPSPQGDNLSKQIPAHMFATPFSSPPFHILQFLSDSPFPSLLLPSPPFPTPPFPSPPFTSPSIPSPPFPPPSLILPTYLFHTLHPPCTSLPHHPSPTLFHHSLLSLFHPPPCFPYYSTLARDDHQPPPFPFHGPHARCVRLSTPVTPTDHPSPGGKGGLPSLPQILLPYQTFPNTA